jgi:YD repeat-containing protein
MGKREETKMRNIFGSTKRFQASLIAICFGASLFSVGNVQAGRITYAYDALNRLTRAVYDKTTFTYTYDKAGNRLSEKTGATGVTCDFDNNGKTDILWRHKSTGQNLVWLMNGVTYLSSAWLPQVTDTNWKIGGAEDFNSDGQTDILWQHATTGAVAVWFMDGTTWSSTVSLPGVTDLNWKIAGAGDFNGDGQTDILWRNLGDGRNSVWLMTGTTYNSTVSLPGVADSNWEIVGP